MAQWHFNPEDPWVRKDPTEDEFFTAEGHHDALVREAIQNSMDASIGGPVTVRFALSLASPLPEAETAQLVGGLYPHLNATENKEITSYFDRTNSKKMSWLAVEDFGTRGLIGDAFALKIPAGSAQPNDFYYFFRNVGRSGKSDTDRGRWGLGKTVFAAASSIRAIFGLTVREGNPSTLLMGQSVLKTHEVGGEQYGSYGFFSNLEKNYPQPTDDLKLTASFASMFKLKRGAQTGLSIVVPFPLPSLNKSSLVESVVQHFFLPVVSGGLKVEVADDAGTTIIDGTSIDALVDAMSVKKAGGKKKAKTSVPPLKLARWLLQVKDDAHIPLKMAGGATAPVWSEQLFDAEVLSAARTKFAAGERLAVRVPLLIKPKGKDATASRIDVYLEKDTALAAPDEHYVRGGMSISGIRVLKQAGVRGIVVVHDKAISRLMGDAENPAHTEWPERGTKVGQRYEYGPSTVSFVKKALAELASMLATAPQDVEKNLLRDIFSIEAPEEEKGKAPKDGGTKGSMTPPDVKVKVDGPKRPFRLVSLEKEGGFAVRGGDNGQPLPKQITVRVAYERRSGNPFKAWSPYDFDLSTSQMIFAPEGVEVLSRSGNEIAFRPLAPVFELKVTGFDKFRDLRVLAHAVEEKEEG